MSIEKIMLFLPENITDVGSYNYIKNNCAVRIDSVIILLPELYLIVCIIGLILIFVVFKNLHAYLLKGVFWILMVYLCVSFCFFESSIVDDSENLLLSKYVFLCQIIFILLNINFLYTTNQAIIKQTNLGLAVPMFTITLGFIAVFFLTLFNSYNLFLAFLCVEGIGLCVYILILCAPRNILSVDNLAKYFIQNACASGVLFFGVILLFGQVGSLSFESIKVFLIENHTYEQNAVLKIAVLMLLTGFLFKLGSFPFAWWIPDLYSGVWTPLIMYFTTVVKVGFLIFFYRLLYSVFIDFFDSISVILILTGLGSIIFALNAFGENQVKRFLAYSSCSHLGFILLALSVGNIQGLMAAVHYLIFYILTNVCFFNIMLNSEEIVSGKPMFYFSDLTKYGEKNYDSGLAVSIALLSFGGFPPFVGFFGKYLICDVLMFNGNIFIVLFILILSTLSLYYYLKLVKFIWYSSNQKKGLFKYFIYKVFIQISDKSYVWMNRGLCFFLITWIFFVNLMEVHCIWLAESAMWHLIFN